MEQAFRQCSLIKSGQQSKLWKEYCMISASNVIDLGSWVWEGPKISFLQEIVSIRGASAPLTALFASLSSVFN
jgi:hypothetical protein